MKFIILVLIFFAYNSVFSVEYTENHLKLADELIDISEINRIEIDAMVTEVLEYLQISTELENYQEIRDTYIDLFINDYLVQMREIYVSYYSEDDIKELLQFYKSEIGQKVLKNSGQLRNDIELSSELWTEKIYSKLESMVNEERK